MYKNDLSKIVGKTQAAGAQVVGKRGFEYLPHHQIAIELSGVPTAGTLKIEYLTPGATAYVEVEGSPLDLTAIGTAAAYRLDNLFVSAFRFTPDGFDADKSYSVFIASNE